MNNRSQKVIHPIPPLFDAGSEILILGSFPSVKSREAAFFYGHPQNRFWKLIAQILGAATPETIEEKKELILKNHLALWDVIAECEITGSSDSSIRNVKANDLSVILDHAPVRRILLNGKTAGKMYKKYILSNTEIEAIVLPSTSPANAGWSLERLKEEWRDNILK